MNRHEYILKTIGVNEAEAFAAYREFYSQFVSPRIRNSVEFGIGLERIKSSTDPYFNDIPLKLWDELFTYERQEIYETMLRIGETGYTLSDLVSIGKEAARQIKAESS